MARKKKNLLSNLVFDNSSGINDKGFVYSQDDLNEVYETVQYNKTMYGYYSRLEADLLSGDYKWMFKKPKVGEKLDKRTFERLKSYFAKMGEEFNLRQPSSKEEVDLIVKKTNAMLQGILPTVELRKSKIAGCNRVWQMEEFTEQRKRIIRRQYLCGDKLFCPNCKKVLQGKRMAKYIPVLKQYSEYVYHVTLTVPNCTGTELPYVMDKMETAFNKLVEIFKGNIKTPSGLELWNYLGCMRSEETSIDKNGLFHHHYHCAFVFLYDDWGKKYRTNKFSFSNKLPFVIGGVPKGIKLVDYLRDQATTRHSQDPKDLTVEPTFLFTKFKRPSRILVRKFNDQELMLQKVWYLLYNDQEITEDNLRDLRRVKRKLREKVLDSAGYSCVINKFPPNGYGELFKYLVKDNFIDEKGNKIVLDYKHFVWLYLAYKNKHDLVAFGCLNEIVEDDETKVVKNLSKLKYENIIEFLRKKESSIFIAEKIEELIKKDFTYITKKRIFGYLFSIYKDNNLSLKELCELVSKNII